MSRYVGPVCPDVPAHGVLHDWPTDRWAYHCSHQEHDGHKDQPQTRAFFTTAEVEASRNEVRAAHSPLPEG